MVEGVLDAARDVDSFGGGDDEDARVGADCSNECVALLEPSCEFFGDAPPNIWILITKRSELWFCQFDDDR